MNLRITGEYIKLPHLIDAYSLFFGIIQPFIILLLTYIVKEDGKIIQRLQKTCDDLRMAVSRMEERNNSET
jgi:hypothetical protein